MNYFKDLKLTWASKFLIGLYLTFLGWWVFIQILQTTKSPVNLWFAALYSIIPLFSGLTGTFVAARWRKVNRGLQMGVLSLSLGLIAWGVGEVLWAVYNLILKIEVPYPSFADAGFVLSIPLWTFGVVWLAKGIGVRVSIKNPAVKILLAAVPLVTVAVAYYLIFVLVGRSIDPGPPSLKKFFDISYPLWDIIIFAVVLGIDALAIGSLKSKFIPPLVFISLGMILTFFADLGFTYETNIGSFYNGGFIDLLYVTSLFLLGLGVNTLVSDADSFPNLQSMLLKQREEELREANLKLQERDQMLSRINQEIYKKNLELIEEKRKAEALLYNVTEAVLVLDRDAKTVLINRSAQTLFGTEENLAKGFPIENIAEIIDGNGRNVTGEVVKSALEHTNGVRLGNLTLKRKEGKERYLNLAMSKVSVEKDSLYVLIISDVTEEIKASKAREEFISIASHELRTPMTIVKNYLWMLQNKKGGELMPKQLEYVNKAIAGTERMLKLIRDMLDISRMEQGKLELHSIQVDLSILISDIASDFRVRAEQKNIEFNADVPADTPKVRADEDKLREVIVNLVGNALKFTDRGFVRIEAVVVGKEVKVLIKDSGKGVTKDDLPKLFSKFGRLDNTFVTVAESGGTGLGLYIVKSIVEAMGGKVGAYSEGEGKGSTFWFTLRAV